VPLEEQRQLGIVDARSSDASDDDDSEDDSDDFDSSQPRLRATRSSRR
jgi:hypothetical protein